MKIHSREERSPDVLRPETGTSRGFGKYFRNLLFHLKKAVGIYPCHICSVGSLRAGAYINASFFPGSGNPKGREDECLPRQGTWEAVWIRNANEQEEVAWYIGFLSLKLPDRLCVRQDNILNSIPCLFLFKNIVAWAGKMIQVTCDGRFDPLNHTAEARAVSCKSPSDRRVQQ